MIKNIKRVGIIFLAIAIVCLMVIGCLVATKIEDNNKLSNLNAELDSNIIADTEVVPDIILVSDSSGSIATKWNQAVDLSVAETREVFVRLDQNWNAELIAGTTSFGTGSGFTGGALCISAGVNIKLDLNGYTIDRRLGNSVVNGSVILVYGTFTLMDNQFEANREKIYNAYNSSTNKEMDFRTIISGKITGGYTNANGGGGIKVSNGTFTMQSGMICNNSVVGQGGGINAVGGKTTILDCVIANNYSYTSNENGAGIYIGTNTTLDMYNGIIYGNIGTYIQNIAEASPDGAGITISGANAIMNIYNGIFSKNKTLYGNGGVGGAIMVSLNSKANITGGLFEYNEGNKGSAIGTWGGDLNLSNARIENNYATDYAGGVYVDRSYPSSVSIDNTIIVNNSARIAVGGLFVGKDIIIGSGLQIYNNSAEDTKYGNMRITQNKKIIINEELINTKIGVNLEENKVYTTGYSAHNGNTDPNNYFFSDLSGEIVHLNSAGELEQAKTIASSKYDYIYLENNERKSYKENGLIHGNNDFDKKQTYNGGKLILGKVSANTSVNDFVAIINFGGAVISLLNAKGEIVYGKDADSKFTDKLNNASEYAVGTGWKLKVYTTAGDLIDEISISVLGDLTGDGKVNSADINYLRQVANNGIESLSAEQRLSSLIVNKGNLPTITDTQILWEAICGRLDLNEFI